MKRLDSIFPVLSFACIGAGVLVVIFLKTKLALFGGGLLVAIGAVALARRSRPPEPDVAPYFHASGLRFEESLPDPDGMTLLSWRRSYECGHPVLDAQHRRLLELGNALIQAVLELDPKEWVEALLDELVGHILTHFDTEEAVLARTGHPLSLEHRRSHAALLQRAQSLRDRYGAAHVDVEELVNFTLYDLVADHIVKEDLRFALP